MYLVKYNNFLQFKIIKIPMQYFNDNIFNKYKKINRKTNNIKEQINFLIFEINRFKLEQKIFNKITLIMENYKSEEEFVYDMMVKQYHQEKIKTINTRK